MGQTRQERRRIAADAWHINAGSAIIDGEIVVPAAGGPVFNLRSEGRHFDKSNRCPASAFFEFTGKKYPKAKHRFTLNGVPFLAIAGIWREIKPGTPPAFTMLTTSPGADAEPYHSRQVVVLPPED